MNTIDVVVDHLHNQMLEAGCSFYDSPEWEDVNARLQASHVALERLGLSIEGVSLAVSDLIETAEDYVLSAESWGFKKGFAAALMLKVDLMEWAKAQAPPALDFSPFSNLGANAQ